MKTGNRYEYTDEPLTDEDWEKVLALNLPLRQTRLLKELKAKGGTAIPIAELSKAAYFRGSCVQQMNQKFSTTFKVPYRLGSDGSKTWYGTDYHKRALKLYKVKPKEPATMKTTASKLQGTIRALCEKHPTKVLRALLEVPFWPDGITAAESYERFEDDSRLGQVHVTFSPDGDAWLITVPDPEERRMSFRFRTYHGRGQSLRVRTALTFLAVAIDLDNKERPQSR